MLVGGPVRKEPEDQHQKNTPWAPSAFKEPLAMGLTVKSSAGHTALHSQLIQSLLPVVLSRFTPVDFSRFFRLEKYRYICTRFPIDLQRLFNRRSSHVGTMPIAALCRPLGVALIAPDKRAIKLTRFHNRVSSALTARKKRAK